MKSSFLFAAVTFLMIPGSMNAGELETLTTAYERERARVLAPVELKYKRALQDLKLKYTKAGRLEEAIAVTRLLESMNEEETSDWLLEADTQWKWHSGGQFTIQKNGRCTHSGWKRPGKWSRIDTETIEVIDDSDRKYTITFTGRSSGKVNAHHGGSTLITLLEE